MKEQLSLGLPSVNPRALPQPPHLRVVCSLSLRIPKELFVQVIQSAGVTAIGDCRLTRTFTSRFHPEKVFWNQEEIFRRLCEELGVEYLPLEIFAPTSRMRQVLRETFKEVDPKEHRFNPRAWTEYLEDYEQLMLERRPLHDDVVRSRVIEGPHEVVAFVCSCRHHDDCHRSYVTAMFTHWFTGVELRLLYPNGHEPPKASPRRYRLHAFPLVGLPENNISSRRKQS